MPLKLRSFIATAQYLTRLAWVFDYGDSRGLYKQREKPPCVKTREAFIGNHTRCSWMPVRKSDLPRAGRMGELKAPLLYPEFVPCMMLNQEEEKQEVVLAAFGGQEALPHWTSRSRLVFGVSRI